jgi:bifunctional DNA-binding transcriptional regulator/antitoxin component of YhaV-PrlF toxin-antitoxin module
MASLEKSAFALAQLDDDGQLRIPEEYRRTLALAPHASLVLVQVGDALVIAPYDKALAEVCSRFEVRMREAGVTVDDLIESADEARAELVRETFGDEDGQ